MDLSYTDGSRYDPEIVRFFDVAHTGAHVRALAQYVASGAFDDLLGMSARSVIVVSESAEDAAVVQMVTQAVRAECPVMVSATLPLFVGPLDIVLIATDGSLRGEEAATAAMSEAVRRGVRTLLVQGSAALMDESPAPVIPVPPTAGPDANPVRLAYAISAVLQSLVFDKRVVVEELERVADLLDEDMLALSPERDVDINPARQLRCAIDGSQVVHTASPEYMPAAQVIARVWQRSGLVCFAADAKVMESLHTRIRTKKDIFYDPYVDTTEPVLGLKVVVWGVDHAPEAGFAVATYAQNCEATSLGTLAVSARFVVRALAAAVFECNE